MGFGLGLESKLRTDYKRIDLIVVYVANLINVIMVFLFVARISGSPQVEHVLGIMAMIMGFALGYVAFLNKRSNRDKWDVILLLPIFLFFVIELLCDYVL